ncbi:cell division protein FtsL [Evansella sp. LMS18]|jgi:cell division protein FtsL|uniref:cell division protein FtsL n=1 Tax=Evansella sp. LMS18 TaxID=2924033 RepID=UPI0020D056E3|nr:cell division protein FtsL [Evansella sp. LMS18]UTR10976.1 cell division protein FtsL [Evansella sp. LMS18]
MSPLVQKQAPYTSVQPQRERRTVTKRVYKGRVTKGEKLIYIVASAAFVFVLCLILSNYASIYMTNHQIQQTEVEISQQTGVNEALSLQVMELSDPERILSEAKDMGMVLNEENVRFTHQNE